MRNGVAAFGVIAIALTGCGVPTTHAEMDAGLTDAALDGLGALDAEDAGDAGATCDLDTVSLAVTREAACRVDRAGRLSCWGSNDWGQVRPSARSWVEPFEVLYEGLSDVREVAMSSEHACVVQGDGTVSCWGTTRWDALGAPIDTRTTPTPVLGVVGAEHVVVGVGISCARDAALRWWCWGDSRVNEAFGAPRVLPMPTEVPGMRGARTIRFGYVGVALWDDGHVESTRSIGATAFGHEVVPGIDDAIDVVTTELYACVLHRTGRVSCWGDGYVGTDPVPVEVDGLGDVVRFASANSLYLEACAVRSDGSLWCWRPREEAPRAIATATDVDLAALGSHFCVSTCGGVRCNGRGGRGENGDGETRVPPHAIPLGAAVAVGGDCALLADGTVRCWERHAVAPFAPCDPDDGETPRPVPEVDHAVWLGDGCAIRDDGTIVCQLSGSLRLTYGGLPSAPVAVARGDSTFATTADGRLFGWNPLDGSVAIEIATAAPVLALAPDAFLTTDGRVFPIVCSPFVYDCRPGAAWPIDDAVLLWAGRAGACVRHATGAVDCRFRGVARVPLAAALGIPLPAEDELVNVPVLDQADEIAIDRVSLCARIGGAVECWGDPGFGRLGSNDAALTHTTPVAAGAADLGIGASTCAVLASGMVTCWGLATNSTGTSAAVCPLAFTSDVAPAP